jgi:3'(2'), 5'-bisphosphate nucleotidase
MSLPLATEKQVAVAAVRRACALTSSVFNRLVKNETLTKGDKSPVTGRFPLPYNLLVRSFARTVGDYSAQAVINTILGCAFPEDPIVGEEDTAGLREASSKSLRDRIVELANEALTADLGLGDNAAWGIGPGQSRTADELLDAIDRGNHTGGRTGRAFIHPLVSLTFHMPTMNRNVDP